MSPAAVPPRAQPQVHALPQRPAEVCGPLGTAGGCRSRWPASLETQAEEGWLSSHVFALTEPRRAWLRADSVLSAQLRPSVVLPGYSTV